MTIRIAAYLQMCEHDGEHGRFVLSTGESSMEFCSKEVARQVLNDLWREEKITKEEKTFLGDCLDSDTKLPPFEKDAEALMLQTCLYYNDRDTDFEWPEDDDPSGVRVH